MLTFVAVIKKHPAWIENEIEEEVEERMRKIDRKLRCENFFFAVGVKIAVVNWEESRWLRFERENCEVSSVGSF